MADVATGSNSGPHLPHLLKWIKHRASKKENRYASKKDKDNTSCKSDKPLYDKTAIVSRSSDNIHRVSTDISLSDKARILSHCAEFNTLQRSPLKSESMVALSSHMSTDIGDVICKHGSIQRTCRSCMQLPPLPPGHERVLRDLQRQEKKRLRQSMQTVQVESSEPKPNLIQHTQPGFIRVRTPLHNSSSPEPVYEEIPINFFRGGHVPNHVMLNQYDASGDATEQAQFTNNGELLSHQRYPSEMCQNRQSYLLQKPASINHNKNVCTKSQTTESRPNSRQVSLGNLDFGMAKECDGFLVVPLRDKTGTSPVTHSNHWQDQSPTVQPVNSQNTACPPCQPDKTVLPQQQEVTSPRISHCASDSGYLDQLPPETKSNYGDCDSHTANGKGYTHCKRCKRPHGLYHGVSLCHSDVEDLRQELQYLDIAGLDKHKLRASTTQSSPSLMHNVTHRRSAFSKYIPKRKSSERSSSGSSYNRVPIRNDCNMERDLATLTTDSYKRQSMSAESDYFSSNYNTSQSDTTSRGSRDYNTNHSILRGNYRANYVTTSENSNDTFSEYDITPESSQHTLSNETEGIDSNQLEYEYYLAKARHHNMLKNNVKRILRSSESERSDAERSALSDNAIFQDDTISLTSVTSLSELSTMPCDENTIDRLSCRVHRSARHHQRSSKHHHHKDPIQNDTTTPSPVEGLKPQTRTRKPIRKKRKTNKMEYYKLPDFSGANLSPKQNRDKNSDTLSVSSHGSGKRDIARVDTDFPEEHKLGSGSSEKLSCRVTDFKLSDIRRTVSKCTEPRINHNAPAVSCDPDPARSSVYSNHGQINRNSNNRLLSDLMRMNHDRQLFSLL